MEYNLEIIEQPVSKIRFRYDCEGKSHGVIKGINSTKTSKTFPTIKIAGYKGPANFKVSLVTKDSDMMQHVHELSGISSISLQEGQQYAMFSNLSIVRIPKKSMIHILEKRLSDNYLKDKMLQSQNLDSTSILQLNVAEEKELSQEAQNIAAALDIDCVRFKFEADILNGRGEVVQSLTPIFSNVISNIKSNGNLPLKIIKLDKLSGWCNGNQEIILLCEKIQKDDISIRFFEEDQEGNVKWESLADFSQSDVHHKYAIVFKTPAYSNMNLQNPKSIKIQLLRPSDQEVSNSMDFTYMPLRDDEDVIKIKRQKSETIFDSGRSTANILENKKLDSGIEVISRGNEGPLLNTSSLSIQNQSMNKKVVALMKQMQISLWMYVMTNNVLHLLTPYVSLIFKGNEDGDNALHLAIIHGKEDVSLKLLEKLRKKKKVPTATLR